MLIMNCVMGGCKSVFCVVEAEKVRRKIHGKKSLQGIWVGIPMVAAIFEVLIACTELGWYSFLRCENAEIKAFTDKNHTVRVSPPALL